MLKVRTLRAQHLCTVFVRRRSATTPDLIENINSGLHQNEIQVANKLQKKMRHNIIYSATKLAVP